VVQYRGCQVLTNQMRIVSFKITKKIISQMTMLMNLTIIALRPPPKTYNYLTQCYKMMTSWTEETQPITWMSTQWEWASLNQKLHPHCSNREINRWATYNYCLNNCNWVSSMEEVMEVSMGEVWWMVSSSSRDNSERKQPNITMV
jgi:hypothetical protein